MIRSSPRVPRRLIWDTASSRLASNRTAPLLQATTRSTTLTQASALEPFYKRRKANLKEWGTAPAAIKTAIPSASLGNYLPAPTKASGRRLEERASLQESRTQVGSKLC